MGHRILLALLVCAPLVAEDAKIPPSEFTAAGHTTDKLDYDIRPLRSGFSKLCDVGFEVAPESDSTSGKKSPGND